MRLTIPSRSPLTDVSPLPTHRALDKAAVSGLGHSGPVFDADAATRLVLLAIAAAVLRARRARGWSQRRLASEAGVSQSIVAKVERVAIPDMPIATAIRVLAPLDIPFALQLPAPMVHRVTRDAAHARCIAHVIKRLERTGYAVASEVEVSGPGWTGAIDVLAFHPVAHVLLIFEVKTEIHDLGGLDRQLGRYERCSWEVARALGWRPRAVTGVVLVLWTAENDRRLAADRAWFVRRFKLRARALGRLIDDPEHVPDRGVRGVAMLDPRSRRARWPIATRLDGRNTLAPYADRAAFLAGGRAA